MYRYSPRTRGDNGSTLMRKRVQNVFMLLLVIAVIVLAIFGGNAMKYESEAHDLFIQRMRVECNDALQLCNTLSRTAGSSSSSTLGRIRQHIYSMQTINDLNVGLEGAAGGLVDAEHFSNLYSILEQYETRLVTGMTTGDNQTQLLQTLTALYAQVEQVE